MKYLIAGLSGIRQGIRKPGIISVLKWLNNIIPGRHVEKRHTGKHCGSKASRTLILLKPNTYMNLSGKAVNCGCRRKKFL
jgi:peptidyl-tRNA hydrolase